MRVSDVYRTKEVGPLSSLLKPASTTADRDIYMILHILKSKRAESYEYPAAVRVPSARYTILVRTRVSR